ncbi:hypothetical protein AB0M28_13600 [Streptomyces sp. NPDC051940]|uniref:hypothetical protein n=1 Tax=Streptomyces sp. NPDC051940 TaxID=3155675 RepID=UPI003415AEDF
MTRLPDPERPDDGLPDGHDSPGTGEQLRAALQHLADAITAMAASLRRAVEARQAQYALAPPSVEHVMEPVRINLDPQAMAETLRHLTRKMTTKRPPHSPYRRTDDPEPNRTEDADEKGQPTAAVRALHPDEQREG